MTKVPSTSKETSFRMAKVRQKNTDAEIALRKELYQRGLRYRVNFEILKKPRRVADIVFPGLKIAIFVDGCFWHGCPDHGTWPKNNAEFWRQKIETNIARDNDTNERLREIGWTVLRFWRHIRPTDAADIILKSVLDAKEKRHSVVKSPLNLE
jgi:DNA mismatch endonuclease, patch repair protein